MVEGRDVCVLGRIGYDLYALEHGRPLGEVESFARRLGGSSANIAVGLARLGLRVGMVSAVGDNLLADYLIGFLEKEGVSTELVRRVAGFSTSLCLTEVAPQSGFRQVFYRDRPADTQVEVGERELALVRGARLFVTNGTSLCASPSREATTRALSAAREAGVRTAFDIDYRASSWPSPAAAGAAARAVLPMVDLAIGNEEEVTLVADTNDAEEQVRAFVRAGVGLLVRKRGDEGVEAFSSEASASARPIPVEVSTTIGAGDGFASGFLAAHLEGRPLDDCLRRGNAAAAVVVSRVSCSDAMPYPHELEAMLARA